MSSELSILKTYTDDSKRNESTEHILQKIVNNLTKGLEALFLVSAEFDEVEKLFTNASTLDGTLININIMVEKLVSLLSSSKPTKNTKESIFYAHKDSDKKPLSSSNYRDLEKVLQKYEAEIREHIRVEQQMKIYSESLEDRITELKTEVAFLKRSDDSAKSIKKYQEEIELLKKDNALLERKLAKYKRKHNSQSTCLDRTVKNRSMDHVSLKEHNHYQI